MISGFAYQFLTLILSFVARTVFIHTLGAEYLGLNGIFSDVLNLLSMADLGFNTTMAYSFYKPLAEHDEEKLAGLIHFYKKVYNVIAVVVTVVGIAVIPFLKYIVNTEQEIPHLAVYYLFSLANVVISYLFVYKSTILTADQKNYKVVNISIWTSLLKTILQIFSLLLLQNYILYLAIGVAVQFFNNLMASREAQKQYPFIKMERKITKEEEKGIFENMRSVFLYKISSTIFTATDNILISVLVGTAMTGIYSNYLMVSNKLLLIIQIIFSALTASVGNVIVREKSEKRYEVFSVIQSVSFILCGAIVSAFCIMANDFVYVWLGSGFTISTGAILAMTLNTYLSCVLQPLWIYRDATGLYVRTKYVMLVGAVLNIVLSILLGKVMGLTGIVLASAIARLSTYFWYEPRLLFREYFEKSAAGYYVSLLKNALLMIATIGVLWLLLSRVQTQNWLQLIGKGVVIGGICSVVFLVAYGKTEGTQLIVKKCKSMLGRKK